MCSVLCYTDIVVLFCCTGLENGVAEGASLFKKENTLLAESQVLLGFY